MVDPTAPLPPITLDDKYTVASGKVLLTGIQALVRLPLMQKQRDVAAGLNTAGFISGYRGSPLGGYDLALWRAEKHLKSHNIVFQPGINEDLGMTAVWGSQQLHLSPGARHQGVFGLWYGKGPGVDRSADVMKHANAAGSALHGGVLAVIGDDHGCKSSTFPHQSEQACVAALMPVLHPASVQDILDFGILGWAMARFSGCWVGLKLVSDIADSTAVVEVEATRPHISLPTDYTLPPGGLSLRWPDPPLEQEQRLITQKLPAVLAFARANRIDRETLASPLPRLGIIAPGKSYLDVRQALDELGLDDKLAAGLGVGLYKVGMPWPLEPEGIRAFAAKYPNLLVVEEKRAFVEPQLKEILYGLPEGQRPPVIGKRDLSGAPLMPEHGEISARRLAVIIGQQLVALGGADWLEARLAALIAAEPEALKDLIERKPHYCSGCPHNTSTKPLEGSRVLGGIGCHYMALWMERKTETFSQMGGEGVPWIGTAPFTDEAHIFANLGDGTYFHSGLMAIRAAVSAKVNITYKLLYNDAVAMTGGQPVDGPLSVATITRQLHAEGVSKIIIVADEPKRHRGKHGFAPGVLLEHRDNLASVQRELRVTLGTTVLIYDQTCAAEKRRRRKRGTYPDPAKRVVINDLVCEGCGDCSTQSNCLSVVPLTTEFGQKRTIDQSTCNKDFSCVKGFCPSFVTVLGGQLKKGGSTALHGLPLLPEPTLPKLDVPWNIMVTGIGGTGIITVGALLAMAAHLEGNSATVLDQTGLAQKGGAVFSHVRLAKSAEQLHAVRLASGSADLLLAGDLVVSASYEGRSRAVSTRTHGVVNTEETIVAEFTRNPNSKVPGKALLERLAGTLKATHPVAATRLATALFGDSIATNLFLLGFAWQKGLVPVGRSAIERAIELNGVQVEMNTTAFLAGRSAAHNPDMIAGLAAPKDVPPHLKPAETLDEMRARREAFLTDYQNAAYAQRYRSLVDEVAAKEKELGLAGLTEAVVRYAFKLMAYKDEYEVARLHSDGAFIKRLKAQFTGRTRLQYHLAPPLFSRIDPETGSPRKITLGGWWVLPVFWLMARMKFVRGTLADPFGWTRERRNERMLRENYFEMVRLMLPLLTATNHATALRLARLPEDIRGYGHIKAANLQRVMAEQDKLIEAYFGKSA